MTASDYCFAAGFVGDSVSATHRLGIVLPLIGNLALLIFATACWIGIPQPHSAIHARKLLIKVNWRQASNLLAQNVRQKT
jgi:hypothetical protein